MAVSRQYRFDFMYETGAAAAAAGPVPHIPSG
jgi:hypothetical protein